MARSLVTFLGAVVLLLAAGCGGDGPQLGSLRADPVAAFVPDGARVVLDQASPQGEALGKPNRASVTRAFTVDGDPTAAFEATVAAADAAGWDMGEEDPDLPAGGRASGRKTLATGDATLTVGLVTDPLFAPSDVDVPFVSVRLVHDYQA